MEIFTKMITDNGCNAWHIDDSAYSSYGKPELIVCPFTFIVQFVYLSQVLTQKRIFLTTLRIFKNISQ